jgi:hypothetical protein
LRSHEVGATYDSKSGFALPMNTNAPG